MLGARAYVDDGWSDSPESLMEGDLVRVSFGLATAASLPSLSTSCEDATSRLGIF